MNLLKDSIQFNSTQRNAKLNHSIKIKIIKECLFKLNFLFYFYFYFKKVVDFH